VREEWKEKRKMKSLKKKIITSIIVSMWLIIAGIYMGSNRIEITETKITLEKMSDSISPLKIIHLSDLHGKDFGRKIINIISELNPDIVIFSGDMINSHNDNGEAVVALLQGLNNQYPVYYAYGNHDLYCRLYTPDIFNVYKKKLEEAGCIILDNAMSICYRDGKSIAIYGLSSIPYGKRVHETPIEKSTFDVSYINQKIGKTSDAQINLLIAHDPTYFDLYAEWGADFVLSGHMHGGAVRLPFIGGVFSPNLELMPQYDAGLFKKDSTFMYVSRGLGTSAERIRVFNRPELAVIIINSYE